MRRVKDIRGSCFFREWVYHNHHQMQPHRDSLNLLTALRILCKVPLFVERIAAPHDASLKFLDKISYPV
jgi:hypothetical protein